MEDYQKAIDLVKKYKQENILKELEKNKKEELIQQVLSINFEQIEKIKEQIGVEKEYNNDKIENIQYIDANKLTKQEKMYYEDIGKEIISKGKYAVVTMAGGQRNKTWT